MRLKKRDVGAIKNDSRCPTYIEIKGGCSLKTRCGKLALEIGSLADVKPDITIAWRDIN